MGQAISITNRDHSAAELRLLAAKAKDAAQARRLLALALLLEGRSRSEAASQNGMQRQTLRDWVHRYNAEGVAGLGSRSAPGPRPLLSDQQMAELRALVVAGPDPETDGVVRWRCADLREQIARRYSVQLHERTVGKLLRKLRLTRLQPRPCHPKKDAAAQQAFTQSFAELVVEVLPAAAAGKPLEVWFEDEARVGQKGSIAYVWAPIGSRPPMLRDNRHDSVHLFGAICPARGVGAAIIMPAVNTEAMNEHLKEISTQVTHGAHAVLVCDGAGWHQQGGSLQLPDNISLLPLPPYAPELNPMENVWAYLRANKLCRLVWDGYDAIVAACKDAWHFLVNDPARISSIGTRDWACVNV